MPAKVRVSPVLKVSFDPLSAARVRDEFIVVHERTPDPFVVRACPLLPAPSGRVRVVSVVTAAGARIAIELVPFPLFSRSF